MSIQIRNPYRIIPLRHKRYETHYQIPASQVLVVPVKELGDEVSCEIRWEDSNGELQVRYNAMFVSANLVPLNPLIDEKLFEIWTHYYSEKPQVSI